MRIAALAIILLFWGAYLYVAGSFRYVALDNGVMLKPQGILSSDIAMYSETGERLLEPQILEVYWNERYVLAHHVGGEGGRTYWYKIGGDRAFSSAEDRAIVEEMRKQSNLQTSIEIAPNHFQDTAKTYWDLVKDPDYKREWYE